MISFLKNNVHYILSHLLQAINDRVRGIKRPLPSKSSVHVSGLSRKAPKLENNGDESAEKLKNEDCVSTNPEYLLNITLTC